MLNNQAKATSSVALLPGINHRSYILCILKKPTAACKVNPISAGGGEQSARYFLKRVLHKKMLR